MRRDIAGMDIVWRIVFAPVDVSQKNNMKYSPEEIVNILHSIRKLSIDECGELDTRFADSNVAGGISHITEGIHSFQPGSFTRELLELIQTHLTKIP